MSVFNKLSKFIRSGRSSASPEDLNNHTKKYEAAARIVEEENLAKQLMPTYNGLERYTLQSKLGDGAFSIVYKALDTQTDGFVAVKAVRKSEMTNQQKASVLKETQIMRTLNHKSIVRLLDFIETNEHFFLILELCEGGELFHQIVRLTYFSEDLSRHCIRQVAEGIRYLHEERGIVHRDIKPENLLFDPVPFMTRTTPPPPAIDDEEKEDEGGFLDGVGGGGVGRVKIADFGLSKVVWEEHTMTPCGTVGYTAPEIVKDERYSKSVDMWALGCVLYTLLCGFPPFYDESIPVLTEKVAKGQFVFLSPWWDPISKEAKDLISNLLCVNPRKRYTIDQFLKHPWMKKGLPITQRMDPIPEPTVVESSSLLESMTELSTSQTSVPAVTQPQEIPDANELRERTEAEKFKRMYQQRESGKASTTTSGHSTPASERRRDLYSDIASMKEMFDVTYAVHRITEEKSQQRKLRRKQQQRQNRASVAESNRSSLETKPDEETSDDVSLGDESTDDMEDLCSKLESKALNISHKATANRASEKSVIDPHLFELDMNKASLLEKRRRRHSVDEPSIPSSAEHT